MCDICALSAEPLEPWQQVALHRARPCDYTCAISKWLRLPPHLRGRGGRPGCTCGAATQTDRD